MPRASKVCSQPRCHHAMPCPVHPKIPWQGSKRRTELPRDWEHRRQRVIRRDEGICQVCLMALGREVHHVGDKDDHRIENLQLTCVECHMKLTQAQAAEARGART